MSLHFIAHSTISRMILERLALSSLYFLSSPEPLLSVVATLFVCVVYPLRRPIRESTERRPADESGLDEGSDGVDDMDGIEPSDVTRPFSTIVGLLERRPLGGSGGIGGKGT